MSERAEREEQRLGEAAGRIKVRAVSEFEPNPARNRKQQDDCPADCDGYRDGGEKRQPLPELHAEKYVAHQDLRKFVFDVMSFDVIVELGNFAERVGGKEPDFAGVTLV